MSPQASAPLEPGRDPAEAIRNFCIIAHIDHGKSTLADRMLQITGIVEERAMRAQYLDRMDIERERGITIKSQAVRMPWELDGKTFALNMIDTPGHVDFSYEVSRSLAACEGAILLVDAAQGIEAQTLAKPLPRARERPRDHPGPQQDRPPGRRAGQVRGRARAAHRRQAGGRAPCVGKNGVGVPELLDRVVGTVPPPVGTGRRAARAMIFDSVYDSYRGVVTYVRMVDGTISPREKVQMMSTKTTHEILEIGVSSPEPKPTKGLSVGEVGYLITGVKDVRQSKVGDTVTSAQKPATDPLAGYTDPKPMVFSGLYPIDGSDYPDLARRSTSSSCRQRLVYEPETSVALGFGFRCGFLGLLHLEIITERLSREFGLDLITTAPSVIYEVTNEDNSVTEVTNPSEFRGGASSRSASRWCARRSSRRRTTSARSWSSASLAAARCLGMEYLGEDRVEIRYEIPLGEIVFDFFDQLKSKTQGYASLDYEPTGATRRPTSSRSTSSSRASRSTRSARSSTATRRTRTARS